MVTHILYKKSDPLTSVKIKDGQPLPDGIIGQHEWSGPDKNGKFIGKIGPCDWVYVGAFDL